MSFFSYGHTAQIVRVLLIISIFYCFVCFVVQRGWCHVFHLFIYLKQFIFLFVLKKSQLPKSTYKIPAVLSYIIFNLYCSWLLFLLFQKSGFFFPFFFGFLMKRPHPWPLMYQGGGVAAGTGTARCPTLYCQPNH